MPAKGKRKAIGRMDAALAALTPFGFSKKIIHKSIRKLLEVYEDTDSGWFFIEEGYYKILIEKILEEKDGEREEWREKNEESADPLAKKSRHSEVGSNSTVGSSTAKPFNKKIIRDTDPGPSRVKPPSESRRKSCNGWLSEDEDE